MKTIKLPQLWKILFVICLITGVISVIPVSFADQTTNQSTHTVTDMAGRTVTLPASIDNILALYGPAYEKIVILDAEDKIGMCADYHKTHASWAHVIYKHLDSLPSFSNPSNPNVEDILKENPDVVFYFGNDKNTQKMESLGIPVVCSTGNTTKLESLKDSLRLYGKVLGSEATERAEEYCTYFDEKLKNVLSKTSSIADKDKPKVYVTSGIPLRTRSINSVMGDTVTKAGGDYVAKDIVNATATINPEQLVAWNPDIIIIDHAPDLPDPSASSTSNTPNAQAVKEEFMSKPEFQNINAVKNKQVYICPMGAFFWDAGQQGILQLEWMAQIFHPELFKDLDMSKEVKEFYSKFFNYDLSDDQLTRIMNHELPENAKDFGY
ncbi:ABC transporter substrate-binding protein [Methanospirillum lacunae]|uniref:ABC transporter substrate-binding protein n=2 Tax=Methanospirillum lacunae TaxID=668570 RepID=A0A2V2MYE2_9EURY|nr:ABC transporter substrate-binding protein [Methanospirillum lacunae]